VFRKSKKKGVLLVFESLSLASLLAWGLPHDPRSVHVLPESAIFPTFFFLLLPLTKSQNFRVLQGGGTAAGFE